LSPVYVHFAGEGAAALCPLVPVAFPGGGAAHRQLPDFSGGKLLPVLAHDLELVSRHRLSARAVANVVRLIAEKSLQHLRRAQAVENVHSYDCAPLLAEPCRQRLAG
jgi:hypothetical protein